MDYNEEAPHFAFPINKVSHCQHHFQHFAPATTALHFSDGFSQYRDTWTQIVDAVGKSEMSL
jgi:hypothetical protein